VRISVHLHPYGDGRTLLLSRDVTALEQAEAMRQKQVKKEEKRHEYQR